MRSPSRHTTPLERALAEHLPDRIMRHILVAHSSEEHGTYVVFYRRPHETFRLPQKFSVEELAALICLKF